MFAVLLVVFALFPSPPISANSTGSALPSKTNGYSSQIGTQESPFSLTDNDATRALLQEPEDPCSECPTWSRLVYNETITIWILDDSALDSGVVDIQCIVTCAYASDTIVVPTNRTLLPKTTITIDKPLTITGFHEDVPRSEGTYPAGEKKTAVSCPEGSGQGIFDIRSGGVTIANLQIGNCSFEGDHSPVVIQNCERNTDDVQIHNVEFMSNHHRSQLVVFDVAKPSRCGTLKVINVTFKNNRATGRAAVVQLGSTTIMRNVRIENNRRVARGTGKAFLVFAAYGMQSDSITLNRLIAKGNRMPILNAKSGTIEILNSDFRRNRFGTPTASMMQFSSSIKTVIRNCTFEKNAGAKSGMIRAESIASLEILGSTVTDNTKFGSVIFSTGSELSIRDGHFSSNNGASNGGVIHLENSTATLNQTTFRHNKSGQNGGSVYAVRSSTLTIANSTFMKNKAREGGCFYIENSDVEILNSTFQSNKADVDGGVIRVEHGGVVCSDSVFEENSSLDEGGAIHIENARYITMQSLNFTSRNAAFGSVVRIDKSRTGVILKDVHFRDGVVELTGAALYVDDSDVTIDGATFINNTGPYGGAIYAQKFDVTIKNATFLNNSANVMGGAISGDNGNISIMNATFQENRAYLGGALHFYNATFNASEIVLLKNNASEGGGLQCKDSNVTIGLPKEVDLEILNSEQDDPESSFGIDAQNNTGIDGGGAINAKDSNLNITYGTFSNNAAPEGGAVQLTSSEFSSMNISHSWFEENVADVRGGALSVRSADEGNVWMNLSFSNFSRGIADQGGAVFLTSVNATIEGCKFDSNTAIEGGAALFQKNIKVIWKDNIGPKSDNINIDVKNCSFEGNRARDHGGALVLRGETILTRSSDTSEEESVEIRYEEEGFNVSLKSVNVARNRARRNGGGVYGQAVGLDIQGGEIRDNTAPQGGGVYLTRTRVNISDSSIICNVANSSGGGIMLARESNGTLAWINFMNNGISVDGEGGGLCLSGSNVTANSLNFTQNRASFGGGVGLVPGSRRNTSDETSNVDSGFLCVECTFLENKAGKSGGGLNVQSQESEVPAEAQLNKCHFERNIASVFGGGIHFLRPFNQTTCTNWTSCAHLVILNSSFVNNTAERSGGSLLSNAWDGVLLNCSQSTDNTSSLQYISVVRASNLSTNQPKLSPQCIGPENRTKETPPLISSYARECIIKDVKNGTWNKTENNRTEISETVPGEGLPDMLIECYDEFWQFARSDSGDRLRATLKSKNDGDLKGVFVTDLTNGTGNITGVRNPPNPTFDSCYPYELEISFSLDYVKSIDVLINVRACRINEQKQDEGVQCKECDATQYNFNPMDRKCSHCDDTLDCSGTYVFPNTDFWHWSPCHVPAQKCLTSHACNDTASLWNEINETDFENLAAALNNSSCIFSNASLEEYHKLQCKEGYEGVLCGSCTEDYGRSLSFACTKCNGPGFSIFIFISVCLWLAAIAAITIRGSMTIEERLTLISKKLHDIASPRGFRFRESIPEESEVEKQEEKKEDETTKIIPPKSKALKRSLTGASTSTASTYWIGYNLPTTTVTATGKTPEEINNYKLAQLAKWKLCEVVKVTINFLQAISVAAVINVEWTRYMLTMFNVSALAGGASTALMTRTIQCFPWWNGTKYATYAGLVSSVLVPTFVILCIVVFFALIAYKTSKGLYYFVKRSILATLAICYFSYLSITKVAVMVFYCIGVRTDNDFSSEKETHYWALDTSIECADKDHKGLMVFGGILFALFSVGFPLISAFILVLCRKGSGSTDPQWMTDILGFLYRAYKREFVYWESTVMLRKALLSAIAVFSYHLGGHSQGLLASCILSVCLFFQAIYKPYRIEFDTVNNIESLSLLIAGITFTLAQFFMKDRTNEAVKIALSVILMVLIIGFLVYLILRLFVCVIDVFKTDLRAFGQLNDENENSWNIVGTWVASRLGFSERPRDSDDMDVNLGDVELGSMKSGNSGDNMSDTTT